MAQATIQLHDLNALRMSTVDWRWASIKGFWDKQNRCWNEENGGMMAYLAQRDSKNSRKRINRETETTKGIVPRFKKTAFPRCCISESLRCGKEVRKRKAKRRRIHGHLVSAAGDQDAPFIRYEDVQAQIEFQQFVNRCGLGQIAVRRFWTYGYRNQDFARILNYIPYNVLDTIVQTCQNLQLCVEANTKRLLAFDSVCTSVHNGSSSDQENATRDFGANAGDAWEEEVNDGVLHIEFDPCTQRRRSVMVNSRAALLMNLRKQDLILAFEDNEVPLLMTEMDALRIFMVELHCFFKDRTIHYLRRIVRLGTQVIGMLLCCTRVHVFTRAGQVSKVKDRIRVVNACEYDHALRHFPSACPLALMGDRRSGQELLDNAQADARLSIKDILFSNEGLQELNELIICNARLPFSHKCQQGALQDEAFKFETATLSETDNSSSTLSNNESIEDESTSWFSVQDTRSVDRSQFCNVTGEHWSVFAAHRFWNVGHRARFLETLFNAVPHKLVAAITKFSKRSKQVVRPTTDPIQGMEELPASHSQDWLDEEEVWDEEESVGFLRLGWEPSTNLCMHISLNHCYARWLNMSKDEAHLRLADQDLSLISSEMDLLRSFLFHLFHESDDEIVEYTRRIIQDQGSVRASLVCIRTKQIFNPRGQVYETKQAFTVITSQEYDEALATIPWACPLAVMGDQRKGHQLLARAAADARKTVASLASTHRGTLELDKMIEMMEDYSRGPSAIRFGPETVLSPVLPVPRSKSKSKPC